MTDSETKVWGLVPAAGTGVRMGASTPKQYLEINGCPIIHHTLEVLCNSSDIDGVAVGLGAADEWWERYPYSHSGLVGTYTGGSERMDTVINGLDFLQETAGARSTDWVAVHDAVRPLVSTADIRNLVDQARQSGVGAILGVPLVDTLKVINDENAISHTADRTALFRAMTPQVFVLGELADALADARDRERTVTDESMAMELLGKHPVAVTGSPANIKLTLPEDLEFIRKQLEND